MDLKYNSPKVGSIQMMGAKVRHSSLFWLLTFLSIGLANADDIPSIGASVYDSYVNPKGAFVNTVIPHGAGDSAGLMPGDVITEMNGHPISSVSDLSNALANLTQGNKLQLKVARNQGKDTQTLRLIPTTQAVTAVRDPSQATRNPFAIPRETITKSISPISWTTFHDPQEGAFTLEVPLGWSIRGGSQRMSASEIRTGVDMTAPDGTIEVFFGDNSIPFFTVPNPMLQMAGLSTGSVYNMGYGQSAVVMPYMTGEGFAAHWGNNRINKSCQNAQLIGNQSRPSESQALAEAYAAAGISTSVQSGEAEFTCRLSNGTPAKAYVFSATELAQGPNSAMWNAKLFTGYIADQKKTAEANQLLQHIVKSFTINPTWASHQQQLNAQTAAIVSRSSHIASEAIAKRGRTMAETSDIIVKGGQARSEVRDRAAANYDEYAVRGTSTYEDPATGDRKTLDNRYDHQYTNSQGQTISTDSPTSPGIDWREMNKAP